MSPCSPGGREDRRDGSGEGDSWPQQPRFPPPWAGGPLTRPVEPDDCFSPKVTKKKQFTDIKRSFLHFYFLFFFGSWAPNLWLTAQSFGKGTWRVAE